MKNTTAQLLAALTEQDREDDRDPSEQGTIAAFLEGQIHKSFTTTADKLYQLGLMTREERIALSSSIGDALSKYGDSVLEKCPRMTTEPMPPEIAQKLVLGEQKNSGKEKVR
jgi:hypothetical protein